jgi:phenylpropionate dioxygenase-like ring-hydroxylating dioxygenase large terminal subunit
MLTREENELLTRTGPGTPMGGLMRRYWIPALFSEHVATPDCTPVRVGLLGEKLVAFRDTEGRIGLLDERCPHRTASMFYGRNEECGLRCVYHGWKFDIAGNCTDLPSEPPGGNFQSKIRIKAYPCLEQGGVVWTYMGPPELKPEFPELEWTLLPDSHRFATRHVQECNWLQGLEGGFDTSHLAFLHRGTAAASRRVVPSRHEVIPTEFGFVAGTGRALKAGEIRWAANLMLMPFHKIFATQPNGAHIWVPIDDENTMLYSVDYQPHRPLEDKEMEPSRNWLHIHTENLPGSDRAVHNRDNDYLIDRQLQQSGASYTGMRGLSIQDCAIQESMGPIADRTIEHLGVSDTSIIQIRRLLLQSVKDFEHGTTPPGLDPASYRARSSRFTLAEGESFQKAVDDQLNAALPAHAG